MPTTNPIPYNVTLNLFTSEQGKLYIIPTKDKLDEMLALMDVGIDALSEKQAGKPDDWQLDNALRDLQRERAQRASLRDHYLPLSKATTYALSCPSYAEYLSFRAHPGVRTVDTKNNGGEVTIDDERLMEAMLPKCVQGMDEQTVKGLHPDICVRLYAELKALVQPDASELPTIAS